MTPESLGFTPAGADSWAKPVRTGLAQFRLLTTIPELLPLEELQRSVMGVSSDLDIYAANELIILPETGGHVIGAFMDGELAGALFGFGGYVDRRPRILSDWMGVWPRFRSAGLGAELKRLQAAIAFEAGFAEIVWTVDPLRAANARLNFEKLGAWSDHYEEDRYGAGYAPGLYGGMPTDRLHMTWSITDPAVHERLLGRVPPLTAEVIAGMPEFAPGVQAARVTVAIPADIDRVVASDPAAALDWRMRVREQLQAAFAGGYRVDGFVAMLPGRDDAAALVLTRKEAH